MWISRGAERDLTLISHRLGGADVRSVGLNPLDPGTTARLLSPGVTAECVCVRLSAVRHCLGDDRSDI